MYYFGEAARCGDLPPDRGTSICLGRHNAMPGTVLELRNKLTSAIDREGNVRVHGFVRSVKRGCQAAETRRACSLNLSLTSAILCRLLHPQVLNMEVVLEVVGLLEQTAVTAEELQVSHNLR